MTTARFVLAAALVCLIGAPAAIAQESRGTITGTVVDASRAVVPGASVTITNVAMDTSTTVTTNEVGFFQAQYLIPGPYRITVELSGFKKLIRDGIEVRVGDRLQLELPLQLGGTEEQITVTAETPLLETTSASLGQVIDARRVAELPIPHGDPYALIGLAAGASFMRSARLDRPFEPTHIVGYAMNGVRSNRSDVTIDGLPSTSTANAGEITASFVPPQGLVQEFKVQTAIFDASFGNTEGGVTNLVLKSGTNKLAGEAYFVKTPKSLWANDFFANANNIPLPEFRYTRWSAVAGGPVVIPGLYNGRGKTFFIYGYETLPEARPRNNGTPTVPTEKMRNGDFSELLALGPQYQIYNPFTRRAIAGGRFQQDPFVGNIVPRELMNPVALKLLEYIGHPRTAGNADGTNNYLRPEMVEATEYGSNTVRIDHNITQAQRMYGRVSWYDRDSNYNNYFDNIATGQWFRFVSRQAVFDHVWTMTPTMVMNVRYGYDRFLRGDQGNPANRGMDLTTLGFPNRYNDLIPSSIRKFPRFDIAGYQGTGVAGEDRFTENQTAIATVTKTLRAHSVRTGIEWRRYREKSVFSANNQTGQFNFGTTWTRGPLDNSTAAPGSLGQSFAAFLLGLPETNSIVSRDDGYDEWSSTTGIFVQDDWRLGSKLTLNLGLRYEVEAPLMEAGNRSVRGFDLTASQAIEAAVVAALNESATGISRANFNVKGGITFPGVNGQPRGLYETPKNNLMPRLGLAYTLDRRTVLRAGYGVFYGFLGQRRGDVIRSGFSQSTPLNVTLDNGLTFIETLSNPFQNGILEPVGAANGLATSLGQTVTFFDPDPESPRMQRWQAGIQRDLGRNWVVEARYVGNHGSQLQTSRNLNATPNQFLSTSPTRDVTTINYLGASVANPFVNLMPATAASTWRSTSIPRERLLRPYPQFDAVNTTTNEGASWYHALQLRLDRRFANGYTLGVNYTFSRFEEAIEFLNGGDAAPWRGISSEDVPHRLAISGIVELPVGKGRRFGRNMPTAADVLLGGWQLGAIYSYQTGTPLGWGNIIFTGDTDSIDLPGSERTLQRWFNIDAGFNRESTQQLGSNVRTFPLRLANVRRDNINNVDLSVIKNTLIAGKTLQFRAEALNAFNHVLLPGPNTSPTAAAFGQISASTQDNYSRRVQAMVKFIF
jgi:carboxypeptidase family protein/TonB-dependent receptor-like protein